MQKLTWYFPMKKFLVDLLLNIVSEVVVEVLNRLADWFITYPWLVLLN